MIYNRKNIRLHYWDYSSNGIYYITICCNNRELFFGSIDKHKVIFSEIGKIALQYWMEIPLHFPHVKLDEFVIMPNHVHGIIVLDYPLVGPRHGVALHVDHDDQVGTCHGMSLPRVPKLNPNINKFSKPVKNSVSVIINQYKSSVKRWCNKNGYNQFCWQSRFYDMIVNNENSLDDIRTYIISNPKNWKSDELYYQ
jgi:putative transposase